MICQIVKEFPPRFPLIYLTLGSRVIIVKLIAAYDIDGADMSGNSDPYVEFSLKPADKFAQDQQQHSTVKSRTLNPRWDPPERFQFITSTVESSRIVISWYFTLACSRFLIIDCSYHRSSPSDSKVLGDAVLATKDVSKTPTIIKLKLINSSGRFKGEVGVFPVPLYVH